MNRELYEILDQTRRSPETAAFDAKLGNRVVGQNEAVEAMVSLYQQYRSQLTAANRPVGTLLFLGPTGTGKTKTVEAAAEVLFGDPNSLIRIDCAEFQHSHEIAKLIGSPPGYLGHRETSPMLTQENLNRWHTDQLKLTFLLFDEIEKASDSLWQLLLGILDKASLTLGDNRKVDFSRTIVVMTSNLGAREMRELAEKHMGFAPSPQCTDETDEKMGRVALEAARKRFSPEFMNRLDKVIVFRTLSDESIRQILALELEAIQNRISTQSPVKFVINYTGAAKKFLQARGIDKRYNARPLKRAIDRFVVLPLANLLATIQIQPGDQIFVDINDAGDGLEFGRLRQPTTALAVVR